MATPPDFTSGQILTAAQMNQVGMWRMTPTVSGSGVAISEGTITATGATSAIVNNCFSGDYDFYRMMIRYQTSSSQALYMRLRTGGSDAQTNYNYSLVQGYLGFGVTVARTSGGAFEVAQSTNGSFWSASVIDLMGPSVAEPTTFTIHNTRTDANYVQPANYLYDGNHSTATAYESLNLFVFSGTFNAKFAIYGYRQ
jgi:hypothetical protein